ncbi:glycosyltransferase family 4 protein [Rhodocyclaceae bacterium SMB388]
MKPVEFPSQESGVVRGLKVAVVTETYPPEINGVAMTLKRMIDGLMQRGHRVQLIRPRQGAADHAHIGAQFDEVLTRGWKLPRYDGLRFGLPARSALLKVWSRGRPDLVHVATEGPLGWSAVSAALKLGVPVTSDFHTNFDHYSRHYGVGWLRQPVAAYLRSFHNRTAATFVPTLEMQRSLGGQGYQGIHVIARGVDTSLFSPSRRSDELRRSWGLEPDDLAVCYVGRLAAEKNLDLVIRTFAAIRAMDARSRLILVGDGPMREALSQTFREGLFAGVRTGIELATHYASADMFLFPSLTETFGNVTLEAMASGLSVLAYDYAAAAQHIRAGANGVTVAAGDEDAFVAQALHVACSRSLRSELGERARLCALECDWDAVNDTFAAALWDVWAATRDARASANAFGMQRSTG